MEVFEPLARERQGLGGGVHVEDRGPRHVTLLEAHAMALLEINRRKQNHGRHLRKLAISARPSAWLFSGWNWVPAMFPRPINAAIGPP